MSTLESTTVSEKDELTLSLGTLLTIGTLIFFPGFSQGFKSLFSIAIIVLFFLTVFRKISYKKIWGSLTVVMVILIASDFRHQATTYLWWVLFWVSTLFACSFTTDPLQNIRKAGKTLIGVCFAAAVLWKIFSPVYLDGSVIELTLSTDDRATVIGKAIGVTDQETINHNKKAFDNYEKALDNPDNKIEIIVPELLKEFSAVLSVAGLLVEGLVAVFFLYPLRKHFWLRDFSVLLFFVSVYSLIPVIAFGLLISAIMIMVSRMVYGKIVYSASFSILLCWGIFVTYIA